MRDKDASRRSRARPSTPCIAPAASSPRPWCRGTGEDPGTNSYDRWIYDNWRGAFDYKALADTLDFISYMTYAQHTGGSPPGPVAGYPWVKACLEYRAVARRPAVEDLARTRRRTRTGGIPPTTTRTARGSAAATSPTRAARRSSTVPASSRCGTTRRRRRTRCGRMQGVFRHAWLEDARAFMAKLELARTYRLRGYSVWVLGREDAAVWGLLRSKP